MDWTDRHYRFMMRLITRNTLLYTEMLVDQTVRTIALMLVYHASSFEPCCYADNAYLVCLRVACCSI